MDTPQLRIDDLQVDWEEADAVLGLAEDGGFWAIGLQPGCPAGIFEDVPMSTSRTGAAQLARLLDLGLTVKLLPPLRDVDLPEDAEAVALAHPGLEFSRCWRAMVRERPEQSVDRLFDRVYAGQPDVTSSTLTDPADDRSLLLDVARWTADADPVDELVVARCESPVIDLGCGPGRMVRALLRSGRAGLGVDMSAGAVSTSLSRGGPALRRLVGDPLPAEGRWGTALLMDSNLGIGGDAAALLRRCRDLVVPGGLIICEVDPDPERRRGAPGRAPLPGRVLAADGVVPGGRRRPDARGRSPGPDPRGGVGRGRSRLRGPASELAGVGGCRVEPASVSDP